MIFTDMDGMPLRQGRFYSGDIMNIMYVERLEKNKIIARHSLGAYRHADSCEALPYDFSKARILSSKEVTKHFARLRDAARFVSLKLKKK